MFRFSDSGVSENWGTYKGSFKGYYKGAIRLPLNKGLGFPEIRGTLFWGPYDKDPTM